MALIDIARAVGARVPARLLRECIQGRSNVGPAAPVDMRYDAAGRKLSYSPTLP